MKRIFLKALCLLATGLPLATLAGVNIEHWTTPDGARVVFVESRALPMLDVQVDFSAGAAYDPVGKSGLAGLTCGLLENGVDGMDEEKIAGRLADIGARFGCSIDYDRASMMLRTLSSLPERAAALDLLHAMLATPAFPAEVLAREKARTIAAIQEDAMRPDSVASKRFSAAIYPGHPYGMNATEQSVGSINRGDLAGFWRNHYGARRATISIIGDVSRAEAEAIAIEITRTLPQAEPEAQLPEVALPRRETFKIAHPAQQSHIYVGMPSVKRGEADFFPMLLGNYTLGGGGFVSRLMKEVREKRGYAYNVYSYFSPRRLAGPFQIGLQTKREQAGEALKVVESVLDDFLRNGPTDAELAAAKQNLVDGMALRLDSNAKILGYLSLIGFYNLPLTWLDDFPQRVNAVTVAQVREVFARRVRPEHLVTVIVAGD